MITKVVTATVAGLEVESFFLGRMRQRMIPRNINSILC